jgi:hypothetical protein
MRSQVNLFLCYPLAFVAVFFGGVGLTEHGISLWSTLLCGGYYFYLLRSLCGCVSVGGWAARFYQAAVVAVLLQLTMVLVLLLGLDRSDFLLVSALLAVYPVYLLCSLAGADLARRAGRNFQAALQVMWPLLFVGMPMLGFRFSNLDSICFLVPFVAFGAQGIQALLLALSLDHPEESIPERSPPAIGWESP